MQNTIVASGIVKIRCRNDWDDCQKKQMCAKVNALNKAAPLKRRSYVSKSQHRRIKRAKKSWQQKYHSDWNKPSPQGWSPNTMPKGGSGEYLHSCAEKNGKPLEADHVIEVQLDGNVRGPFKWLDSSVNGQSGREINSYMKKHGIEEATSFKADCCP